jgi:acylphosphatase
MIAARFIVRGRVQGVAFRAHTREQAQARRLRGHACNRADGAVEVVVVGDAVAVEELAAWLAVGPPLARVDSVERSPADAAEAGEGFLIG